MAAASSRFFGKLQARIKCNVFIGCTCRVSIAAKLSKLRLCLDLNDDETRNTKQTEEIYIKKGTNSQSACAAVNS